MSLRTGREHVRVARALENMPLVGVAFGRGELSYSKVRALTRMSGARDEADLVALACTTTAHQLDRVANGYQQATTADDDAPVEDRVYEYRSNDDGTATITLTGLNSVDVRRNRTR